MKIRTQELSTTDLVRRGFIWSRQNWTIIRFCLLFFLYVMGFLFLIKAVSIVKVTLSHLATKEAQLTSWFLGLLGIQTQTINAIVFQSRGFAIEIIRGCTGIKQFAFLAAGVLAYKCSFRQKIKGLVLGIVVILFSSLVRAVSLFIIGIYARVQFDIIHDIVWEILMILITFTVWLLWLKTMNRIAPTENQQSDTPNPDG